MGICANGIAGCPRDSFGVSLTGAFGTMGSIRVLPDGLHPSLLYVGPSGLVGYGVAFVSMGCTHHYCMSARQALLGMGLPMFRWAARIVIVCRPFRPCWVWGCICFDGLHASLLYVGPSGLVGYGVAFVSMGYTRRCCMPALQALLSMGLAMFRWAAPIAIVCRPFRPRWGWVCHFIRWAVPTAVVCRPFRPEKIVYLTPN